MADTEAPQNTTEEEPMTEQQAEDPLNDQTEQAAVDSAQAGDANGQQTTTPTESENAKPADEDVDDDDDEDERKLFVGGLSWDTQQSGLKDYMSEYGDVKSCIIKIDNKTGRSRCFGFVVFAEVAGLNKALENRPHKVDGREIDSKKAEPQRRESKLFVGGVKPDTTEEVIRAYFSEYGKIVKIERPFDQKTQKFKGFCFITFSKDGPIAKITKKRYHELDEKEVECKHAEPLSGGYGGGGRGRGRGGGMGGWGGPGGGGGGFYGGAGGYGQGFGFGGGGYQFPGGFGGGGPYGGGFGGGYNPGYGGGGGGYGGGGFGYNGGGGHGFGQQSSYGKAGRGGRHQNNFKPY